jgi:hypothetical protein
MPTKRNKHVRGFHAHVWSSLTVASFLIAYIIAIVAGVKGIFPFVYGGLALLAILGVEALLRGHIWPFDEAYRNRFSDIDGIALRLLLFCGAFLLILETTVLVMMWV